MTKIKAVDYLIKRLYELGITEVFGLPGDFNFKIVEAVERNENVNWIGCVNELNAGYAADGYARLKGYGAIVTTFGVGELSAINAIAGSMSENIPVIKIVGIPATKDIKNKTLLHHNLDTADYRAFERAYSNVVETTAFLDTLDSKTIKSEVDRVINVAIKTKKPVYIALPIDVCDVETDDEFKKEIIKSDEKTLTNALNEILKLINSAKNPVFVADVLTKRFNAEHCVNDFLSKTKMPSACFIRGIDVIDFETENYLGVYNKANTLVYNMINSSDCLILAGSVISDLNTSNFDFSFDLENIIDIQPYYTKIKGKKFDNVLMSDVIEKLTKIIEYKSEMKLKNTFIFEKPVSDNKQLSIKYVYSKLNEFLKENDNIISEVGLVPFGTMKMKLKKNITIQNQMLWGSIGWATPCTLGCLFADKTKRTVLITGDGSHQLCAVEIATMLRHKLKPVIFIINNSGYTIERILCDNVDYKYNDISKWNYSIFPKAFDGECFCAQVKTNSEFDNILNKIEIENKTKMCYIELITDYLDLPELALSIAKHPQMLKK